MNLPTLDLQMMERFREIVLSHPDTLMDVSYNTPLPPMHRVLKGELVHVMVKRGPLTFIRWTEKTPELTFLFDAYGN